MNPATEEIFRRLLDESAALLSAPGESGLAFPEDDLHREILLPLLPAMLGDAAIRKHWQEQVATGFPARLARHLDGATEAPSWVAGDFEIHVTASYSAGPDAKALADTLLSEDSLREMSAALMNQVLGVVWPRLPMPEAKVAAPAEIEPAVEAAEAEVPATIEPETAPEIAPMVAPEMAEPIAEPEPVVAREPVAEIAMEDAGASEPALTPSRALLRALCMDIPASEFQTRLAALTGPASAAILARRIARRQPRDARVSGRRAALRRG